MVVSGKMRNLEIQIRFIFSVLASGKTRMDRLELHLDGGHPFYIFPLKSLLVLVAVLQLRLTVTDR